MKFRRLNSKVEKIWRLFFGIIFIGVLQFACTNDKKNKSQGRNDDKIENIYRISDGADSIKVEEDKIDTVIAGLAYLKVDKVEDGVNVRYKYKNEVNPRKLHIVHPSFSDIIFPNLSVGVVGKWGYKEKQFCTINDSLLVLPLIGISNRLHVYVVNLLSEKIYEQDIRTFFSYVWVNPVSLCFITSNEPIYDDDIDYEICVYKIRNNDIVLVRKKNVKIKFEIDDNEKEQFKYVKAFLK